MDAPRRDTRPQAKEYVFPERLADLEAEQLDQIARESAKELSRKPENLDTQVRRIMGAVRKLEVDLTSRGEALTDKVVRQSVMALRPRLAYAAARNKNLKELQNCLHKAVEKVQSERDFKRLIDLVEAIVGYYKAYKERVLE